jgi:hypothetical protein
MDKEISNKVAADDEHLPVEGPGRADLALLYSWSFDEAWSAQEAWETKHDPEAYGRGPLYRWLGADELKVLYGYHKEGKMWAVLEAFYVCCLNSLPIPRWCEFAYLASYRKVREYRAKSWDDVFGKPHPKGTHLATKKQERENRWKVYRLVEQIKRDDPKTPIDGCLFERIGKQLGIGGKTLTEQYYYYEKNRRGSFRSLGDGFNERQKKLKYK